MSDVQFAPTQFQAEGQVIVQLKPPWTAGNLWGHNGAFAVPVTGVVCPCCRKRTKAEKWRGVEAYCADCNVNHIAAACPECHEPCDLGEGAHLLSLYTYVIGERCPLALPVSPEEK